MNEREEAIKGIYNLVTRKTTVSELDPNYLLISEALEKYGKEELRKFFKFYATNSSFFNKEGFSSILLFQKALREYREHIADTLWQKKGIEEKTETLTKKIIAIYDTFLKKLYADELKKRVSGMFGDLGRFKTENGEHLFTEEERGIIEKSELYRLIIRYMSAGYTELKEEIVQAYKQLYTEEYLRSRGGKNAEIEYRKTDQKGKEVEVAGQTKTLMGILAQKSRI